MGEGFARFVHILSSLLGWTYVLCWSASFYPQPILNYRRKSTHGLTVDFPALNVLGFVSYTISTSCFLYSPTIRQQYALRHPDAPQPTVRFNDFAFAAHALVLVILTYSQLWGRIWGFDTPRNQRMNLITRALILGSVAVVFLAVLMAWKNTTTGTPNEDNDLWTWLDVVYIFGHIKLVATFLKYLPQAHHNYVHKSTRGWSIHQVLLDFAGGFLSLGQLFIDASFQGDWSGILGNLAKFGLSCFSVGFDVIFILQHFVLYRRTKEKADDESSEENARQPLLEDDRP